MGGRESVGLSAGRQLQLCSSSAGSWVTPAGVRKRWETLLVAARDGVVSGWIATYGDDRTFRSHWNPFPGKDVAIRTRPPVTLAGAFSLEGGTPLADARVRLTALFAPFEYDLDRHIPKVEKKEIGLFSGISYAESLHRPWLLPGLKTETTTDKDGRFELPSLPEGFIAELEVAHPQAVTTELRTRRKDMHNSPGAERIVAQTRRTRRTCMTGGGRAFRRPPAQPAGASAQCDHADQREERERDEREGHA